MGRFAKEALKRWKKMLNDRFKLLDKTQTT